MSRCIFQFGILCAALAYTAHAVEPAKFFEQHCYDCHDKETKKGGLDLTALKPDFSDSANFDLWVKVHDRTEKGEMPPAKRKKRPPADEVEQVVTWLDGQLIAALNQKHAADGRAVLRRLTRVEYENAVRDLFSLPDLNVKDLLPADGLRQGYDKVGEALDLSSVQLGRYMEAVDHALDTAIATRPTPPPVLNKRIYPASQPNFYKQIGTGNGVLLRKVGEKYEPDPIWPVPGQLMGADYMNSFFEAEKAGVPKSTSAVGQFHPIDNYMKTSYGFAPLYNGKYRLRMSLWSFKWNAGKLEPSPKTEVGMLYVGPRTLGYFDAPSMTPLVTEITPWLNAGDEVYYDGASTQLHDLQIRQRPGGGAAYVGPGIATEWLEIEGPIFEQWPPVSHRRLFGDLPIKPFDAASGARPPKHSVPFTPIGRNWPQVADLPAEDARPTLCTVVSAQPVEDATRLLRDLLPRAFRRPVGDAEVQRYVALVQSRLAEKDCFEDAMRYACKAALTSTSFLFRIESPGKLDDLALASRLSFWLWNSSPDDELLKLAVEQKLHQPKVMNEQVERLLNDPKSERFIIDFLDQWLRLRDIDANNPDADLYPEFHLYLKESMLAESRAFMRELITKDLSVTNVVSSDFLMVNERLAQHYLFVGPTGSKIRRILLPPDCERSGFITQGSVMKVSANGTTTSPVTRGIWFTERILGQPIPPPPSGVSAVDPDTHGATTIREQLEKHRADPTCSACHAKLDPPGFALENFDVIGGYRTRYRSLGKGNPTSWVFPDGFRPVFKLGPAVDPSGELPDGRAFKDIKDLRKQLLADPDQIARNLAKQLLTYATGAVASYTDRGDIEQIVAESKKGKHGVRNLIHIIAESGIFQRK